MAKLNLKAEKRKIFGRKIKKLRREGILPANIYGKKLKSEALQVDSKEFLAIFKEAGETGIIEISLVGEKKVRPALVHNLQKDPVSDEPLHVDFHQVDLTQKVHVPIPIEFVGESAAVTKGGVLVPVMDEIEVEALPTDLPDKFEVDLTKISEIGQSISVKDLKFDKAKIKILVENEEELIVKVEEPKKEEEEEKPVEEVPAEGEEVAGEVAEGEAEAKPEQAEEEKGGGAGSAGKQKKPEAKDTEKKK